MLFHHPPLFIGYIDPGLGYTFQNLGPIIPAVLGFLGGSLAFLIKPIKKLLRKKSDEPINGSTN